MRHGVLSATTISITSLVSCLSAPVGTSTITDNGLAAITEEAPEDRAPEHQDAATAAAESTNAASPRPGDDAEAPAGGGQSAPGTGATASFVSPLQVDAGDSRLPAASSAVRGASLLTPPFDGASGEPASVTQTAQDTTALDDEGSPATVPSAAGDTAFPPLSDAGFLPPDTALLGLYDVTLEPLPAVHGCAPNVTDTHFNLRLEVNANLDVQTRVSADFAYPYPVQSVANDEALRVAANPDDSPQLTFDRNADGEFTGTGEALVRYTCTDGTATRYVAAEIATDTTPPRLRVEHDFPTDFPTKSTQVPVGVMFRVTFSEMVDIGDGEQRLAPALSTDLEALVAAVDVDTDEVLQTRANQSFGGLSALEFVDYDRARNREVRFDLKRAVSDLAGNTMVASSQTFRVMDVGSAQDVIDFDDGRYPGTYGSARYVEAGAKDSPCESGACVVFEEDVPLCDDWQTDGPTSTFSFRLPLPTANDAFRVRSRLLSTHATTATTRLWWHRGCNLEVVPTVLPSLTEPIAEFTYGTNWQDHDMSLSVCNGQGEDKSLAISLTCVHPHSMPAEGIRVRYVIERIERLTP